MAAFKGGVMGGKLVLDTKENWAMDGKVIVAVIAIV